MAQPRYTVQVVWQPVLVDFCDPEEHMAGPRESHHHMPEAVLEPPLINTKAACAERLRHTWSMLHTKFQICLGLMEV